MVALHFQPSHKFELFFFSFLFVVSFVVFYLLGIKILDPDFGWQLKNGQIILQSGIFYKDLYSYTMPSYPAISHEWGSDVLIATIYKFSGFAGLSISSSLLFLIPFGIFSYILIFKRNNKNTFWWNMAILITTLGIFINYFYVRPQTFSWIFWIIIVLMVVSQEIFKKYFKYLPLLFIVWANLHGGFAIGIVFMFILAFFSSLSKKTIDYKAFFIALLCFLATLVNPFGINLWREVIMTFFGSNVRQNIAEWQSVFTFGFVFPDFLCVFLFAISSTLIFIFIKKVNLQIIVSYIILFILGISSTKNLPYFLIFNLALSCQLIYFLFEKISNNKLSLIRFKWAGLFVFFISVLLSFLLWFFYYNTVSVTFDSYPIQAIDYLKQNLPKGQIFSQYGWGGYLIWNLPQKKVFIDGRMGVWSWNANIPNETNNALELYNNILNEKIDFNEIAAKYKIDTVLWTREEKTQKVGFNIDKVACKYVWINGCGDLNGKTFEEILESNGWKKIYQDNLAAIYRKI